MTMSQQDFQTRCTTCAATLRAQAQTMREKAGKATPGPWFHSTTSLWGCVTTRPNGAGAVLATLAQMQPLADCGFIAHMHPARTLALADALDAYAAMVEGLRWQEHATLKTAHWACATASPFRPCDCGADAHNAALLAHRQAAEKVAKELE